MILTAEDAEDAKTSGLWPVTIDHSADAITKVNDVEVNQQTHRQAAELEIGQKLRAVHRMQFLHCFQLDQHAVFDEIVDEEASIAARMTA